MVSFVLGGCDFVCRCFVAAVLGSGLECCWMELCGGFPVGVCGFLL